MPHRTAIRGVLHGFLGTYMSRYSDYGGYWLFGQLEGFSGQLAFDLLQVADKISGDSSPRTLAAQLASEKFAEQVQKAGLELSMIREAKLTVERTGRTASTFVNGHSRSAEELVFTASAVMDNGRQFRDNSSLLVAQHDPNTELQSARARDA